jgi:ubiquinone biosynthesis protein UbiJ
MLLEFINNLLTKYLESDPEVASQLHELEGQVLLLNLTDLNQEYLITPTHSSIIVTEHQDNGDVNEITATVYSDVVTLLCLGFGADYQSMFQNAALKIDGHAELADRLRTILMSIDIDWEEIASKYVGDPFAYQLGVLTRRAKNYKQRSIENFRSDVSEYLQEESRLVPTRAEIERFLNEVDALDADIERLKARTCRLTEVFSQ